MQLLETYPIIIPFITILLAEFVKATVDLFSKRKKIRFADPGGMPSGHSAFVSSLVVVVAYSEGIAGTEFMIAAAIALIVMYDAINLRNEAGFHAREINKLNPLARLEESLGHNHLEVLAGAVFGAMVSFVLLIL